MTRALLAAAVVLSLWPAAVLAYGASRLLGGGDDAPVAQQATRTTGGFSRPKDEPLDLVGLNLLRQDTAQLIVALDLQPGIKRDADPVLAQRAAALARRVAAWQQRNLGRNADAEFFAGLFAAIASRAREYATAPSANARYRLNLAIQRHQREATLEASRG